MKSFFGKIHRVLSKACNWPIPYWFSPVGIAVIGVVFLAVYHGLDWKLNTENWPFWLWLFDKTVTVGTIVGAAWWAQKIFNENARRRENRERRLKAIDKMHADIHEMGKLTNDFIFINIKDFSGITSDLSRNAAYLLSSVEMYTPELKDIVLTFYNRLAEVTNDLNLKHTNARWEHHAEFMELLETSDSNVNGMTAERFISEHLYQIKEYLDEPFELYDLMTNILNQVVLIHQEIEDRF